MVSHAFIAGLVPVVFAAVSLEIGCQTFLVLRSLVPHMTVTDFEEQQSVVVFLYEIAQVGVVLCHVVGAALQQHGNLYARLLRQFLELTINNLLADAACIYKAVDVGAQTVVGIEIALLLQQNDMIAEGRLHWLTHLTGLQRVSHVLKLLDGLAGLNPTDVTASLCRAFVVAELTGHLGKVSTSLQCSVYAVDALLGLGLSVFRCILGQHEQNVRRMRQSAQRINHVLRAVVDAAGLGFHVVIGDERRAHLLVAIGGELLAERLHRVHLRVECSLHLQLIVNEEVYVFLHGFLVDDTLGIVLIVAVLKLRAQHRCVGHLHNYRVLRLGPCRAK